MNQYSQLRELLKSLFRLSAIGLIAGGGLLFVWDRTNSKRPIEEHITSKLPYLVSLDSKTGRYLWSVPIESSRVGSLTAQSGKLFITGYHRLDDRKFEDGTKDQYHLTALDAVSGKRLWEFNAPSYLNYEALFSTPPNLTSENVTIAVNPDPKSKGKIITLNPATGDIKWTIDRPWMHARKESGITLQKNKAGILKFQSTGISIERIEPLTGKSLWRTTVEPIPKWSQDEQLFKDPLALMLVYKTASTDQYFLVYNNAKEILYLYDWETGKLKNTIPGSLPFQYPRQMSIAKNNLIYDSFTSWQRVKAIDIGTGKEIWNADIKKLNCGTDADVSISPQGLILDCIEFNNDLTATKPKKRWLVNFDLLSGQQRSLTQLKEPAISKFRSTIADSSGLVFTVSGEKPEKIVAIDSADGRLIWKQDSEELHDWVAPITEGDRVYVVAQIPRWRTWLGHISPFR